MPFRRKLIAPATIAALLLLSFPACNSKEPSRQPAPPKGEHASPADTVQVVNGTAITRGDLNRMVKTLLAQKQLPSTPSAKVMEQVSEEALNRLVSSELLYQAARKSDIKDLDRQVLQAMTQHRNKHQCEAEFRKVMKETGLTLAAMQELTRRELMVKSFVEERFSSQAVVSETEAKKFYQENLGRFKKGSSVRASHILVGMDRKSGTRERKLTRDKAQALLERVRAGENFSVIASQYSDCPVKARGGDLGFFARGEMDPVMEKMVFALKVGEISDIVETPTGFHIIKLTEKRGARLEPYEAVRGKVLQQMKREKVQQMLSEYVAGLRSKAQIGKR